MDVLDFIQPVGLVDAIQSGVLVVSAISLIYLWKWNRKTATIEKLEGHEIVDAVIYLEEAIGFLSREKPIPLAEMREARESYPALDRHLLLVLQFYQALARGVKEGIYDKRIVNTHRWKSMLRAYCTLYPHIQQLRESRNRKRLYSEFEEYVRSEAKDQGLWVPEA